MTMKTKHHKPASDVSALLQALPYVCRHDPDRRFLTESSCKKTPLRDFSKEILEVCKHCKGPIPAPGDMKGISEMQSNPQPQAEQCVSEPLASVDIPDAPVCETCNIEPCVIRKDGKSLGVCCACLKERLDAGRKKPKAAKPQKLKPQPPTVNPEFEACFKDSPAEPQHIENSLAAATQDIVLPPPFTHTTGARRGSFC